MQHVLERLGHPEGGRVRPKATCLVGGERRVKAEWRPRKRGKAGKGKRPGSACARAVERLTEGYAVTPATSFARASCVRAKATCSRREPPWRVARKRRTEASPLPWSSTS